MLFLRQLWVLIKKDLLVIGLRSFFSTFLRAFAWPIILTVILCNIKNWTAPGGYLGVGEPAPIRSLADALVASGSSRPRVVIANNGITDGDIGAVIKNLSATIQSSGKELHIVSSYDDIVDLCPSSNSGVSLCYAAVQFYSSPDHGTDWNFTYYEDASLSVGGNIDVRSQSNYRQLYFFPFMHAIANAISTVQNGSALPDIMQFPYTTETQDEVNKRTNANWQSLVMNFFGFAFFVAYSGICYHLPGYVTYEREQGILNLVDAMMPNQNRWQPPIIRLLATHVSFDLLYAPGWIVIAGLLKLSFTYTDIGWLILTSVLFGLALTSFSTLASSLFRRPQLAAISCIVLSFGLALASMFGESPFQQASSLPGVIATGLLFPPCTFVYIITNMAMWEFNLEPFQPNLVAPPPGTAGAYYIGDNALYWQLPTSHFFTFFILQIVLYPILAVIIEKTLWSTVSKSRHLLSDQPVDRVAVRLHEFSRHYKNVVDKKQTVKAVDQLSLNVHKGSITVLLGHNGCGKSTTLNAIAGLETITSGSIEIDGRGGVGICPQKNVMWNLLTVEEHVNLFENLKSTSARSRADHKAEVKRLIEGCDLTIKTKSKAKTLSGGQKRKLQLAMMFAGGSQVCCIDEASSGIDPLARRKIWDILLAERGHRSMLLTTHFLDEADILSDHIIIMSKGQMRAEGSAATLKQQLGGGYRVMVPGEIVLPAIDDVIKSKDYIYTVFETPSQAALTKLITQMEDKGVKKYKIHGPTIEDVFLRLVDEVKESKDAAEFDLSHEVEKRLLELNTGPGRGYLGQTFTLFKKRLMILRHNFMPYVCALFASLVVAGLVTRFLLASDWSRYNPDGLLCVDPKEALSYSYTETLSAVSISYGLSFGPPSLNASIQRLSPHCVGDYCDDSNPIWSQMVALDSSAAFVNYTKANVETDYFGGFFVGQGDPLLAWQSPYGEQLVLSLLDSILLNQTLNVGYSTFQHAYQPENFIVSVMVVFTALGFAIYPCLFALYPTAERLRNVRAMQYSNGIRPSSLWTAHALFDLMFVLIISILTIVIWITQYHGWYGIGYMFVVFFLYGLASTAFSYVVSLIFNSQVAVLAATLLIQVVISMLFFVSYIIVSIQAPAALMYSWMNYIYFTIGIISPAVHLVRGLFMVVNDYSLICRGSQKASYPGEITIYGGPILYLTLQFLFLLVFLIYWESGRSLEVFGIRRNARKTNPSNSEEIMDDPQRLSQNNSGLRVLNATKTFGKNRAVDNVSFGILPSEKFALTGINGAGKTTLISLIRGDLRGSGSVFIGGDSLETSPMAAKAHLGVCPQFDAQDLMTVTEHLRFYANARGVPNKEHNIQILISQLGLGPHANKLAKKLSGGTKRKLSLAIALIANPTVLILDEPSSGMDPAAKRALWKTLSATSAGRSLLITTHSMEEADALCDRAGIMAGRLLALGGMEELRQEHGAAACVHLVHKDAPHSNSYDMERLRGFVLDSFPNAMIETRSFGGQLRFSIPRTTLNMGQLYKLFEDRRDFLGVVDYTIGPSTLDEVFLNIMRNNDVQEENTEEKPSRWFRK